MFERNQFFDGTEVVEMEEPVRRERPRPHIEPVDHVAAQNCELGLWLAERRREREELGGRL